VTDQTAAGTEVPGGASLPDRPVTSSAVSDLRVAHILLRSGQPLPARVQLETLAGRHALDLRGLLDLAESRWRTGDLAGAGEAAHAYFEAGGEAPLADLIAAEAAMAMGQPGEARKLARRALEGLTVPLDAVFAGQARSEVWPHDPAEPAQPTGTLFSPAAAGASSSGRIGAPRDAQPGFGPELRDDAGESSPASTAPPSDAELRPERTIWEAGPAPSPDVAAELDAARAALAANDPAAAAIRLAIVLRLSPALAPAVLDLIGPLPGPDFDLLRGDALRLVGHEGAAERAFAAAAESLRKRASTRSPE
jgi:hypothetical protein